MKEITVALFICLLLCCSCHRKENKLSPELSRIESLMWSDPDSALFLLDIMQEPSSSNRQEYATWCLFRTQAQDKNHIEHTSDSLINTALLYFEKKGNHQRQAQALFYKGQVAKDLGNKEEAVTCYIKAKDKFRYFHDPLFMSLVCQTLGSLYRYQKLNEDSLEQLRDALRYALQVPSTSYFSHACSQLGRTFAECEKWDSAQYYFECSLENAKQIKDLKTEAMATGELGVVLHSIGKSEMALEYRKRELALEKQRGNERGVPQINYGIGVIFHKMGELDSATIYLNEALSAANVYTTKGIYDQLYTIAKKQGRYKDAIEYNERFRVYNDSLTNISRTRAIAEVQVRFDHEKLENERKDLELKNNQLIGFVLGVSIVFIILIAILIFIYQRKLLQKESFIRKSRERIQDYMVQLHDNDVAIKKNEELIQAYSEELQDKEDLTRHINWQIEQLNKNRERNDFLQVQLLLLKQKLNQYTPLLEEKNQWTQTFDELSRQNEALENREKYLIEYIGKNVNFFRYLREERPYMKDADWKILIEHVNLLYPQFTLRLSSDFPNLSEYNLRLCCLIKMRYTTSQIASLFGISAPSITKQKQRIRECMSLHEKKIYNECLPLDIYISEY